MGLIAGIVEELIIALGVATMIAFGWRCIRGFESTETQLNLERIAVALEKIAKRDVVG